MTTSPSRRRRRWPWIAAAALAILFVAAIWALPALLDLERYRGRIEQALADATGWQAEVGELDFSVLRGLAVTASPARLRSEAGGSFIDIETVAVRAGLVPLFRGELEVRRVELLRPTIEIVRPGPESTWELPVPDGGDGGAGSDSEAGGGISVTVGEVEVSGGRLRLIDRSVDPAVRLGLSDLELRVRPESGEVEGSGRLEDGAASLAWTGTLPDRLTLTVEDLPTELLRVLSGEEVLRPGGTIGGEVELRLPGNVSGTLTLSSVALASGEQSLAEVLCDFALVQDGPSWAIEKLSLRSGGAGVAGTGTVLPLALDLEMGPTPLGDALALARAAFPLGVNPEPPGSVEAVVRLRSSTEGELTYSAEGVIAAAAFRPGDMLPPVEDVRAAFELDAAGALEIRILDGRVAGGPVTGTVRAASVVPLAPFGFDGAVSQAALGPLLAGFVDRAEDSVRGPANVQSNLSVDLSGETFGLSDIRGDLALDVSDVRMPGWDLEAEIREAVLEKLGSLTDLAAILDKKQRLEAESTPAEPEEEQLLDSLRARVDFNALPWKLQQLELATGGLQASGEGTFDPVGGNVDLEFTATLDESSTQKLVGEVKQLVALTEDGRLRVPLRVEGGMLAPSIRVDAGGILGRKLGTEKEDVKGLLRGLFDRERRKRDKSGD